MRWLELFLEKLWWQVKFWPGPHNWSVEHTSKALVTTVWDTANEQHSNG